LATPATNGPGVVDALFQQLGRQPDDREGDIPVRDRILGVAAAHLTDRPPDLDLGQELARVGEVVRLEEPGVGMSVDPDDGLQAVPALRGPAAEADTDCMLVIRGDGPVIDRGGEGLGVLTASLSPIPGSAGQRFHFYSISGTQFPNWTPS
jgi:hypothetical protein